MNIIIYSKYASVYAAVHSSVWEAVSRKHSTSDSYYKVLEFLNPTGGDNNDQLPTGVVCYGRPAIKLCCPSSLSGPKGKKGWLMIKVYILLTVSPLQCLGVDSRALCSLPVLCVLFCFSFFLILIHQTEGQIWKQKHT